MATLRKTFVSGAAALLFALLAAFTLLAQTAYAEDVGVSVSNESGRSFDVYQLFSGTPVDDNGVTKLASINWGTGISDPSAFIAALKADATIGSEFDASITYDSTNQAKSADDVAKAIAELGIPASSDTAEAHAFLQVLSGNLSSSKITIGKDATSATLPGYGYYVLVDANATAPNAQSISILAIADGNPLVISAKTSAPTFQKLIAWEDVSTGEVLAWQKGATTDATVQFKLTATMPSNVANYDVLDYEIADVLGGYVIPDVTKVTMTLVTGEERQTLTSTYVSGHYYTGVSGDAYTTHDPIAAVFRIDVDGLISDPAFNVTDDSYIEIVYGADIPEAHQNVNAITSSAFMKYTSSTVANGSSAEYTTAYDSVLVMKPKLTVNKVGETDGADEALAGASFTLYTVDASGAETAVKAFTKADNLSTFDFSVLGDGKYVLREEATPDDTKYEKADDLEFVLGSTYNEDGTLATYTVTDWSGKERTDIAVSMVRNTNVTMSSTIKNWLIGHKPVALPETGGVGTLVFFGISAALVLVGGSVLVASRRTRRASRKAAK